MAVRGLVARTIGPSSMPLVRLLCRLRLVCRLVLFLEGASNFCMSWMDFVLLAYEGDWIAIVPNWIADSSRTEPFPISFNSKFFVRVFLSLKVSSDSMMDFPALLARIIPVLLLGFSFFLGEAILFFWSLYSLESNSTVSKSFARSLEGARNSAFDWPDSPSELFSSLSCYLTLFRCLLSVGFVMIELVFDWDEL